MLRGTIIWTTIDDTTLRSQWRDRFTQRLVEEVIAVYTSDTGEPEVIEKASEGHVPRGDEAAGGSTSESGALDAATADG